MRLESTSQAASPSIYLVIGLACYLISMLDMLADDRALVRFLKRVNLPLLLVFLFAPDLLGYRPFGREVQAAAFGLICAAILYKHYLCARLSGHDPDDPKFAQPGQ